jgi:ribosome-binding protein aMBF1 (putative translation factor)
MAYATMTMNGKKFVLVPETEFRVMARHQDRRVPELPPADANGCRPAVAFADATIARSITRDREAVGMSQTELAEAAGIRVEILSRAERGATLPSVRTLQKIENALARAGLKTSESTGRRRP